LRGSLNSRQKIQLADTFPILRKHFEAAATAYTNIDWSRTKAFCSEVLASPPGIGINRKELSRQASLMKVNMSRCCS
jgi:hypothetical protein